MKLLLTPSSLRGTVTVPPSKSLLHRELICRFLAGQVTELPPHAAQDVLATYRGLACLTAPAPLVDCGDSGSTLRFLLPLFMALGRTDAVFTGSDRLLSRPIPGDLGLRRTEQGLALTGPDGLLKLFTKNVLETALNEELTEHLGHEENRADPGRGSGTSATARDRRRC